LGEAGSLDTFKIMMFPLLLSRTAFSWFSALAPNSISTWSQLEHKFHEHFYIGDNELRLTHLTSVRQKYDEHVADYIRRFRDTKNRCYRVTISEKDLADFALNGLHSHLKDKLEGHEFSNVTQVLQKHLVQESCAKDSREQYRSKADHLHIHNASYDSGSSNDESRDICAAEFVWPSKAKSHGCGPLKPVHKNRQEDMKFTFDVSKSDKIFDALLRNNMIKCSHDILPLVELKRRAYYKWHNSFSHATNDCNVFRR
jgi:hypothetical protein